MAKQSLKINCSGSRCAPGKDVYSWSMRRITVVMTVLCVVFLLSPTVRAEYPFDTDSFPVVWYDTLLDVSYPDDMAATGANGIMAYWGNSTPNGRHAFLNNAAAAGVSVIVGINEAFINPWNPVDVQGIIDLVNLYKDYPAVVGWYTADEPYWVQGISFSKMQLAYNTIKSVDTKPVNICFSEPAVERGIPVAWKTAYDQFQIDSYPARRGESEFSRMETKWKLDMQRTHEQSVLADRPWWSVMEAWGDDTGETSGYRLPTFNESRFMNYYSLSEETSGLMYFAYYRNEWFTPARPEEAYPYNGPQWQIDVFTPLAGEINTLGVALQNGKVAGVASDNKSDIRTDVYYDPDTGKYYLVTLNDTTGSETPTFTVNLNPPGEKLISATPLFEGARPTIPIVGTQFSDEFSQYEVHVYELTTMLLGDANRTGTVSADDYGSVQLNFGDTGAPGLPGDANGSGAVTADDYGSVQLYFGATRGMGGAPVPEPATMLLLSAAGVMMLIRRRHIN